MQFESEAPMLLFDLFRNDHDLVEIKAGKEVMREGDPGDVMYVLMAGEAEITAGGLSVEVARAGDILGEVALIDDTPRSATITARTDCKLAVIDRKRFHLLVDENPDFALAVMRSMVRRLKQADQRMGG
jgi:CRP-like cAMP-binding protein